MEKILNIHIEKLPEGVYPATSESIPGLVAQGRTVSETLEIARDVARKLIEARREREKPMELPIAPDRFDYPLITNHPGDIPEGTLRAILTQGDITPDEFLSKK